MPSDREIWRIARTISEAKDPLEDYHDKWNSKTVLSDDTYYQVVGILKKVAAENGCVLDHRKLSIEFIPPGFIIKNIYLDCPDPSHKKKLVKNLADSTGDETIKHTFDDNLRVNLYNALNRVFGDRVREELNLDVTHQFQALPPGSDDEARSETLPMVTVTTPKVDTGVEDDVFGDDDLGDVSPLDLGPEGPEEPAPEEDLPPPGEEEAPGTEIQLPGFEDEGGEPEGGPEDELPPLGGDEEDLVSFESIQRIAHLVDDFEIDDFEADLPAKSRPIPRKASSVRYVAISDLADLIEDL